jgi:hypothetical protein
VTATDPPVACSLRPAALADRRAAWGRLDDRALRERADAPGGVRAVYAALDGVEEELAGLVRLEADCCAFADWALSREGDSLVLEVTSSGTGAEAVRAMFAPA